MPTRDASQPHESPPSESRQAAAVDARGTAATGCEKSPSRWSPRSTARAENGVIARARKLESFLRDSGQFSYTLQMDVKDRALDPVEDFLVNRKKGHCEYFASALALLLRSVDIPSRVVNGFKGGDWNELTETMNVRQKHAHSWVEAYICDAATTGSPSGSPWTRRPPPNARSRSPRSADSPANFARSPT